MPPVAMSRVGVSLVCPSSVVWENHFVMGSLLVLYLWDFVYCPQFPAIGNMTAMYLSILGFLRSNLGRGDVR